MTSRANARNHLPCIRLERGEHNELIVVETFGPMATCHDDWHQPERSVHTLGPAAFRIAGQPPRSLFDRLKAQIDEWRACWHV
jgi:hypothetical protein